MRGLREVDVFKIPIKMPGTWPPGGFLETEQIFFYIVEWWCNFLSCWQGTWEAWKDLPKSHVLP